MAFFPTLKNIVSFLPGGIGDDGGSGFPPISFGVTSKPKKSEDEKKEVKETTTTTSNIQDMSPTVLVAEEYNPVIDTQRPIFMGTEGQSDVMTGSNDLSGYTPPVAGVTDVDRGISSLSAMNQAGGPYAQMASQNFTGAPVYDDTRFDDTVRTYEADIFPTKLLNLEQRFGGRYGRQEPTKTRVYPGGRKFPFDRDFTDAMTGENLLTGEQIEALAAPPRPFEWLNPKWSRQSNIRGVRPLEKSVSYNPPLHEDYKEEGVRPSGELAGPLGDFRRGRVPEVFGEFSVPINDPRITGDPSGTTYTYLPSLFNKKIKMMKTTPTGELGYAVNKDFIVRKVAPTIKIHPETGERYWYDEDSDTMRKLEFYPSEEQAERHGEHRDWAIGHYWDQFRSRVDKQKEAREDWIPDVVQAPARGVERFKKADPNTGLVWDETLLDTNEHGDVYGDIWDFEGLF